MTLYKQVGSKRIALTEEEEAATRAEWAANEQRARADGARATALAKIRAHQDRDAARALAPDEPDPAVRAALEEIADGR